MTRLDIVFRQTTMAGLEYVGESKLTRHLGCWEVHDGHARVLFRSNSCVWRSVVNAAVPDDGKLREIQSAAAAGRLQAMRWVADRDLAADTYVILDRPYYALRKPPHEMTLEQLRRLLEVIEQS